jgi:cytochrome c oxidase cbb3-type subunit 4
MDMVMVRSILTVVAFLAFLGIVFWALAPKRKAAFDEAANLPFVEGDESDTDPEKREKP